MPLDDRSMNNKPLGRRPVDCPVDCPVDFDEAEPARSQCQKSRKPELEKQERDMTQQRLEDALGTNLDDLMDGVDGVDEVDGVDPVGLTLGANPNEPFTGAEPGEPFDQPITLQDLTNRLIELHREKLDLKTRSENNSAEIKLLEPVISKRFAAQQIQQQKTMTGETVYLQRDSWTSLVQNKDGSMEEAHQALREHGLAWLVKDNVNGRTLSAWVREQEKQETEIPEDLLPFLKISKAYKVKVRL